MQKLNLNMQKLNLKTQKLNFSGTSWRGPALIGAQKKKPCNRKEPGPCFLIFNHKATANMKPCICDHCPYLDNLTLVSWFSKVSLLISFVLLLTTSAHFFSVFSTWVLIVRILTALMESRSSKDLVSLALTSPFSTCILNKLTSLERSSLEAYQILLNKRLGYVIFMYVKLFLWEKWCPMKSVLKSILFYIV